VAERDAEPGASKQGDRGGLADVALAPWIGLS
jgi:hypothetical protein